MFRRLFGKGIEKEVQAVNAASAEKMRALEGKYTRGEIMKSDYEGQRRAIENMAVCAGLAESVILLNRKMDAVASESLRSILGEKRKHCLAALLSKKNSMFREFIATKAWKGIGAVQGKKSEKALERLKAMNSGMVDVEQELRRLLAEDSLDKIRHMHILGSLESRLGSMELKELKDRVTLQVADELVIDVPEKILDEKRTYPKRESRERKRKPQE